MNLHMIRPSVLAEHYASLVQID